MFLWTGRQAVFLLVMLVVCAMALYASRLATLVRDGLSSAVHHHGDFGVGLRHAEISEEKQCVMVRCLGANATEGTPRKVNR